MTLVQRPGRLHRSCLALLGLAVFGLGGCLTPHARPKPSLAVMEARARRATPPAPACPQTALSEISPVVAGFGPGETDLPKASEATVDAAAAWLNCHAGTQVVIRALADGPGTGEEQRILVSRRAEAVAQRLRAKDVQAEIRILAVGAPEPTAGQALVIRAEGPHG